MIEGWLRLIIGFLFKHIPCHASAGCMWCSTADTSSCKKPVDARFAQKPSWDRGTGYDFTDMTEEHVNLQNHLKKSTLTVTVSPENANWKRSFWKLWNSSLPLSMLDRIYCLHVAEKHLLPWRCPSNLTGRWIDGWGDWWWCCPQEGVDRLRWMMAI